MKIYPSSLVAVLSQVFDFFKEIDYYVCPFEILLTRSGSVCIHAKNLQKLMIEIYKSMNHLSPSPVWEFHEKKCVEYNLMTKNLCKLPLQLAKQ